MKIRLYGFPAIVVLVLLCSLLQGCGKDRKSVTMAGSTAFQPFAEKLADQFMIANPNIAVTVQGGGSAVGIQSVLSGAADIGMADLVTLPPEAKDLSAIMVARDGIAVVINPGNSVTNLSMNQLRDIFSGKVNNWKQVGGEDRPVTVVSREAGSGTRSSFEQILGGISLASDALVQDSNGTIRETVANDVNTIGYLSHGLLNEKIKPVLIDGVPSSVEAIMAGDYKLVRPIFLLTRGAPEAEEKSVIDFILADGGQKEIKADGLIPAL